MAVRLHMKLGVVAEHDRLADSPDTLVVVEPSVGSVARSKGHLYLLVTSRISSRHALEATRLAAETIRNEYYYDESAGIRVCLQKAIATANKRLAHQADRLGLKTPGRQRADRDRRGRRPRQRDVRGDGRAGRGLPHPPGAPVDAARPAPRARPPVGRARAGRLAGRDLGRRFARARLAQRHRQARGRRAQGRDADAPPAVGDGAPPPPVRGRRRLRQRRRDRLRGDRGVVDQPGPDARPGPPGRAAGRRAGPLADPARRQRPGGGRRGQRRGRERPDRRRLAPSSGSSRGSRT